METVELDDARSPASTAKENGSSTSHSIDSAAGSFSSQATTDFWETPASKPGSVPSPLAISSAIAVGSPLISFSPVASVPPVPFALDAPAPVSGSSFVVDDLLSFSPVAAAPSLLTTATPPTSSSSSAFGMMDGFFFTAPATAFDSAASVPVVASEDASLLSFSPVASTQPVPPQFPDAFELEDATSQKRESFSGFEAVAWVDDAPKSAPAAFPPHEYSTPMTGDGETQDALAVAEATNELAALIVDELLVSQVEATADQAVDQADTVPVEASHSRGAAIGACDSVSELDSPLAIQHLSVEEQGSLDTEDSQDAGVEAVTTDITGEIRESDTELYRMAQALESPLASAVGDAVRSEDTASAFVWQQPSTPLTEEDTQSHPVEYDSFPETPSLERDCEDDGSMTKNSESVDGETDFSASYETLDDHAGVDEEAPSYSEIDFRDSENTSLERPIPVSIPHLEVVSTGASSVVSSPGSSVAGSAFAFIAAGALSPSASSDGGDSDYTAEPIPAEDPVQVLKQAFEDEVLAAQAPLTAPVENASVGIEFGHGEVYESEMYTQAVTTEFEDERQSTFEWGQHDGAAIVPAEENTAFDADDDDDFGGFAQSGATTAGDEFDDDDDFGDFGSSSTWASSANGGGQQADGQDDDDDFGDFTPASSAQQWSAPESAAPAVTATPLPPSSPPRPPIAAPTDLDAFFSTAFPSSTAPVSVSALPESSTSAGVPIQSLPASTILDLNNAAALHKSFHASLEVYRSMLAGDHDEPHHTPPPPAFDSEALRIKYLKYVLNEKLTEASKTDGVFPHGSNTYHILHSIAESGNEKDMRAALARLQNALFHSSVNEAVLRMAQQAALSAKARIAEQAAQQQAHARSSLLATTRNFLSRGTGGSGVVDKEHPQSARTSVSASTGTPNSSQKGARFHNGSESSGHDAASSSYNSGEDSGSDASVSEVSSHSEGGGEFTTGGSGPPSASSSSSRSGGGLMRKFQDRLTSFSSTKHRARTVSLRRMGQSSEDVRSMALQMESISGGFDEVKWRCAVYLYETDEVAHLAPAQIKIFAYPSNQLLTGKNDKSLLTKFFKPGAIWSIDIGANSNNGVPLE